MNRSQALLSAVLVLGVAAPLAALAQTQASQPSGAPATHAINPTPPAGGTSGQNMANPLSAAGTSAQNTANPMIIEKSRQDVQKVQQALNQNGQQVKVDGIWGPRTSEAVRDFQQKNGLQASGQLDKPTLQKLRAGV